MNLFRELTESEEKEFRQWAKDNYLPGAEIQVIWHPVVQDECRKMNEARTYNLALSEDEVLLVSMILNYETDHRITDELYRICQTKDQALNQVEKFQAIKARINEGLSPLLAECNWQMPDGVLGSYTWAIYLKGL